MTPAIETLALSKTYHRLGGKGAIAALDSVSATINEGEVFALLGLNGAGKSTLVKILLDLVRPTSGKALLFGEPVGSRTWKPYVGYLPELFRVPRNIAPSALLRHLGELNRLRGEKLSERIGKVLEKVGLTEVASQKVHTFSKGMVLRLGIAQTLLHEPRLLFWDEPTEGLDPLGRKLIRNLLVELRSIGTTFFLNSHLLSEIELVADRVAILHKGRIVAQGTMAQLLPKGDRFKVEVSREPILEGSWQFNRQGSSWVCEVVGPEELKRLLSQLESRSVGVVGVQPTRTTLEEVFFSYVGDRGKQ